MGSLTIIFILELVTGFLAFFFVDKVSMAIYVRIMCLSSLEEYNAHFIECNVP